MLSLFTASGWYFVAPITSSLIVPRCHHIFLLEYADGACKPWQLVLHSFAHLFTSMLLPSIIGVTAALFLVLSTPITFTDVAWGALFVLLSQAATISFAIATACSVPGRDFRVNSFWLMFTTTFQGFIIVPSGISPFARWLIYIDPLFYTYSGVCQTILSGKKLPCPSSSPLSCPERDFNVVMAEFGLDRVNPYLSVFLCILLSALFLLLAVLSFLPWRRMFSEWKERFLTRTGELLANIVTTSSFTLEAFNKFEMVCVNWKTSRLAFSITIPVWFLHRFHCQTSVFLTLPPSYFHSSLVCFLQWRHHHCITMAMDFKDHAVLHQCLMLTLHDFCQSPSSSKYHEMTQRARAPLAGETRQNLRLQPLFWKPYKKNRKSILCSKSKRSRSWRREMLVFNISRPWLKQSLFSHIVDQDVTPRWRKASLYRKREKTQKFPIRKLFACHRCDCIGYQSHETKVKKFLFYRLPQHFLNFFCKKYLAATFHKYRRHVSFFLGYFYVFSGLQT